MPHLDSKGGMVGTFSVTAHLKAIQKTELVTGNEWEVLPPQWKLALQLLQRQVGEAEPMRWM